VAISVFFLQKGTFAYDSRYGDALSGVIEAPESVAAVAGAPVTLHVVCRNTGQGRWLSAAAGDGLLGMVNVALARCDASGTAVDRNWRRVPIARDVAPGESIAVECELVFETPGVERLRVELVSEHVTWFAAAPELVAVTVALP
jgi:hypothetical protein